MDFSNIDWPNTIIFGLIVVVIAAILFYRPKNKVSKNTHSDHVTNPPEKTDTVNYVASLNNVDTVSSTVDTVSSTNQDNIIAKPESVVEPTAEGSVAPVKKTRTTSKKVIAKKTVSRKTPAK